MFAMSLSLNSNEVLSGSNQQNNDFKFIDRHVTDCYYDHIFIELVGMSDALMYIEANLSRRISTMRKSISTIVAIGLLSSMLVNTVYAGDRHLEIFNPLWVPVAILSTVAATVATVVEAPFVFEHRGYSEPRQTVTYEEPRHYQQDRHYDRYREYDGPRYREN